jgi:hypothetical protein
MPKSPAAKKDILIQQVQASQLPVHISYFLQKCKKGKPYQMDLPLLKNDITGSESTFKTTDT